MINIICSYCGKEVDKTTGAVNRANKDNLPMFCDRKCSSANKKTSKSEKVENKRLYDIGYRNNNSESLKVKKAIWFKGYYDPIEAAIKRKENMHRHVKYCRQPDYVKKKKEYDRVYRAKKNHGEYWEVALLLLEIQDEVLSRMTRYEIDLESNTLNKSLRRKRHERKINSEKLKECPLGHINQR